MYIYDNMRKKQNQIKNTSIIIIITIYFLVEFFVFIIQNVIIL